jgi:hypothetical protein
MFAMMSRREAPRDFRMPISRVFSRMVMYIASATTSRLTTSVLAVTALMNSSSPLIERAISSANPSSIWQRTPFSSASIAATVSFTTAGEVHLTKKSETRSSWWSIDWSSVIIRKIRAPMPSFEMPAISKVEPSRSIRSPGASRAVAARRESTTTSPGRRSARPATIWSPPPMEEN